MKRNMNAKPIEKRVTMETERAWCKPKKGSIFPAKRRSVKKMIWDSIVELFIQLGSISSKSVKKGCTAVWSLAQKCGICLEQEFRTLSCP
ncbi:hypothetical protein VNO78_30833 [Psophocarpus tetragonolobus]|uniref:Uncharacterized protein n=1 Tax=Psophocarpus tetragonolobus TaxID=3891 RepID=A0AAN9X6B9_PSOTE